MVGEHVETCCTAHGMLAFLLSLPSWPVEHCTVTSVICHLEAYGLLPSLLLAAELAAAVGVSKHAQVMPTAQHRNCAAG